MGAAARGCAAGAQADRGERVAVSAVVRAPGGERVQHGGGGRGGAACSAEAGVSATMSGGRWQELGMRRARFIAAAACVVLAALLPAAGVGIQLATTANLFRSRDDPVSEIDRRYAALRET